MESFLRRFRGRHMIKRTVIMLLAVIVMGTGVGIFVLAAMGSDPYSTLNLGVGKKLGLSFGTWQAIMNIILLAIVVFLDRSKLGLGTLGNMFVIGFTADIMGGVLSGFMPPTEELGFIARVLLTLLGVAFMLVGCSFYVTSGLGMSPYDAISYIVPARTKIPFRWWRIITDVLCVGIGFACGASIGIGTLIMAFGTGPLLPVFNKYLAAPVVGREIGE